MTYREDCTGWTGVVCKIIELVRGVGEFVLCLFLRFLLRDLRVHFSLNVCSGSAFEKLGCFCHHLIY